jgi:hypothetical protein
MDMTPSYPVQLPVVLVIIDSRDDDKKPACRGGVQGQR